MYTSISIFAVFLSLTVPWGAGALLARACLGRGYPTSLYLGHGYLLGYFQVILWFWIFHAAGAALAFWPILAVIIASGIALGTALRLHDSRKPSVPESDRIAGPRRFSSLAGLHTWHWLILLAIAALTLIQLKLIHDEVLLRPTFPWDAWRGWEPETLQHFETRSLSAEVNTVGNYGVIASAAHLWTMLASGSSKAPLTHIPWLFAFLAVGLTVYGHLRARFGLLESAIGGFLCLSMPYLAIHTSLAGYADIWLTLAYTLGVLSLALAKDSNQTRVLVLFVIYLLMTLLSKRAGIPMTLALLTCGIFAMVRWTLARALFVCSIPLILAALVAAAVQGHITIDLELPGLGVLQVNDSHIRLPFVKRYTFELSADATPYLEAIFFYGNWHLTAAILILSIPAFFMQRPTLSSLSVPAFGLFSAFTLIIGFFVALEPEAARDQTALSRTLLYLAPLASYLIVHVLSRSLSTTHSDRGRHSLFVNTEGKRQQPRPH